MAHGRLVYRRPPNGLEMSPPDPRPLCTRSDPRAAPSVPAKYQSVVLRVFAESLAYLLDQLVNRDVHEPTVLRSAIIPDPFDFAVDADQYESVAGFPAGHGPLGGAVAFGDLASLVGKMMAINAVLLNSLGKLGRRIGGYAESDNAFRKNPTES